MTESQPFWIAVYDNDGKVVLFRRVESPSARGALTQLTEQMSAGNADYGAWTSGTSPIWLETMPVQPHRLSPRRSEAVTDRPGTVERYRRHRPPGSLAPMDGVK